ncbi:venom serine carboxypeptidase-like [Pararge aegeria]|uniref:venom serine carboxypeptidase-like n=1 Tax=Pararge aegeria TaxID=116150 RepID=UPI0019D06EE6|nr:venom serine carboxypeptidase-like [Pararge aegeria]
MMKTVILLLVLVTISKGKVVLSNNDDLSNDLENNTHSNQLLEKTDNVPEESTEKSLVYISNDIIHENPTSSGNSGDKNLTISSANYTEKNLVEITNDIIPKDTAKIHIELPVYNITLSGNSSDKNLTNESLSNKCGVNLDDDDELYNNIINLDEPVHCDTNERVDNGTALILTPFIEKGQIEEARNACKVNPEVFLGYESYSGFLTVNKTYNSNTFFWYFPVQNKKVNETPWIIWLQGGPGVSSLTGLFDEIGPFRYNTLGTLKENPHTWLKNHSLVFIDNPVGSGYSFTEHPDGFAKDMATYGTHLYEAVSQLLQIFPELRTAPLYVAGESYAGKYVPALGMEIHKHRDLPGSDINLKGLMIGNAFVDPSEIANVTHPYLYFGLLNREQIEIVNPLLTAFQQDIAKNNSIAAKRKWTSLISILMFLTHQKQAYNFLKDEPTFGRYSAHLSSTEVKKALHVGDIKYSFINVTVNSVMASDFLSSSKQLFEELLDHYRVLAYCGQLDQMLPCVSTSDHYRTWQWNGTSEFLEAARYPYIFNSRLAGYHKTGGRLTEVVIRGAGHMVPMDAPAPTQSLIARWTHNQPLSPRFGMPGGSFLQEYVRNHSVSYL